MVDLAKLTVRLEAENSKLTKALTKSSNDLKRFEGQAKKSFNAVKSVANTAFAGIGVGLLAAGLKRAVSSTLDANDKIAKLAQTTGISVEQLHGLDLAARLSGVSLDVVAKGAGRLQRNMFDAVAGLKEAKDSFGALGVEVRKSDGSLRDTEEVILELADKFAAIEDGAGKAALAQRLFGKAGAALIPLLNQGSAGIQKFIDEQKKLGNVLTADVAAASELVNDNFEKLRTAQEGVSRSITTGMLPALQDITSELVDMAYGSNEASESFGEFTGNLLRVGVTAVVIVSNAFTVLGDTIGKVAAALVSLAQGEFSRAWDIISSDSATLVESVSDSFTSISNIWDGVANDILADAPGNSEKISAPVVLAAEKATKAAKRMGKDVKDEFDLAFDAIDAQFKALDQQEGKKIAGLEPPTAGETRGKEIFESTRTPAEELSTQVGELNDLLDAGDISWDTYSRAIFDAQDSFDGLVAKSEDAGDKLSVFAEQAARNMQDDFAQYLFDPFAEDGLKGMLDGFVVTLRKMASEAAAAKIFEAIGSSASGSANSFIAGIGSFFSATARATGGPLAAGQVSLVGEKGPELFIPKTAGTVIPNNQMAGNITVNVNQPQSRNSQSPAQFGFEVARALSLAQRRNG